MRVIVACPQCCRRYNATGRRPGARFRCLCGESLVVQSPRGHDAAVVRCSACGAPREQGAEACGYCYSDFTLHERDLHSVCPSCLARVSDRARYCHHCATPMIAENEAGEQTEFHCPACKPKRRLISRRLGEYSLAVLECQKCAGMWLGIESLQLMMAAEARAEKPLPLPARAGPAPPPPSRGYRRCVTCGEFMTRRNLARGKSGVLVDLCGRHGVWFDAEELSRLIAWTRTGGLKLLQRDLARLVGAPDETRRQAQQEFSSRAKPPSLPPIPVPASRPDLVWVDVLRTLVGHMLR
jgi:Zn-finger nucleic acid-binding protein